VADIKKASYEIAYEQRQKEIEESLKSSHRGAEPSRDSELEVKPTRDSIQLGEGAKR
jgi:hypothetical protein